jgi:hypothetical protein
VPNLPNLLACGNAAGTIAPRPELAPGKLESPTLAQILADPRFSDRAKRYAANLDGRCKADGKWAAWPKVSTMADDLGWGGDPRAFRKRVERAARELIDAGLLARMRLGELVEWFDSEGAARGLTWPRELPRNLRRSAVVCVLGWRIPGPWLGQPILPRCDTNVASEPTPGAPERDSSVASLATQLSHPPATQLSHPSLNVRRGNGETTTDSSRPYAREGPSDVVRSSSSSSRSNRVGGSPERPAPCLGAVPIVAVPTRVIAPAVLESPAAASADSLAPALERVMQRAKACPPTAVPPAPGPAGESAPTFAPRVELQAEDDQAVPEDDQGEPARVEPDAGAVDPARKALIAKVEEIVPGSDNREVRRAIYDAVPAMLKTANLAESSSPLDHVRMAIEKAARSPSRRDSIESFARGVVRNWVDEGFPAVVAPEPPGKPKPRPDPEADRLAAVERRRAEARAEAEARDRRERWESLPEPVKEAASAEFERANPRPADRTLAKLWEVQRRAWCLERMDQIAASIGGGS